MQYGRFRHAATFVRWRDDRRAGRCTFAQVPGAEPRPGRRTPDYGVDSLRRCSLLERLTRRAREGFTRVGSSSPLGKCGGHGASPSPPSASRAGEIEQRVERADVLVDAGAGVADGRSRSGTVRTVNRAGFDVGHLVPGERRRDAGVGHRPHAVGAGDGAVARVLVVVEEDAVALLLPPRGGRDVRHAPLDLAREREGRADASVKPLPRSTRTLTWMPRLPLVFGNPTRSCSASTSRARSAPRRRTSSHGTPGVGSRSTRSSSGWSTSSARTGQGCTRGSRASPPRPGAPRRASRASMRVPPARERDRARSGPIGRTLGQSLLIEAVVLAGDAVREPMQDRGPVAAARASAASATSAQYRTTSSFVIGPPSASGKKTLSGFVTRIVRPCTSSRLPSAGMARMSRVRATVPRPTTRPVPAAPRSPSPRASTVSPMSAGLRTTR